MGLVENQDGPLDGPPWSDLPGSRALKNFEDFVDLNLDAPRDRRYCCYTVKKPKFPPEVLEYFRQTGREGGRKAAAIWEQMTPEQRRARSRGSSERMREYNASLTPEESSQRGRKGGLIGGVARAQKLTPERRSEIARKASEAAKRKRRKPEATQSGGVAA